MMLFNSPKNFKRGQYILNRYRIKDLILIVAITIVCIGGIVVFMNSFLTHNWAINLSVIGVCLLPIGVAYVFVTPMPVYFNVYDFMRGAFRFGTRQKRFKWEGIHLFEENDGIKENKEEELVDEEKQTRTKREAKKETKNR